MKAVLLSLLFGSTILALPVTLLSSTSKDSTTASNSNSKDSIQKRAPIPKVFHKCIPNFSSSNSLRILSSFNNNQVWDLPFNSNSPFIQTSNSNYEAKNTGPEWILDSPSNDTLFEIRSSESQKCVAVSPLSDTHLITDDCYSPFVRSTLFEISCDACSSTVSPTSSPFSTSFDSSNLSEFYTFSHTSQTTSSSSSEKKLVGQNCQIRNVEYHRLIEIEIDEVELLGLQPSSSNFMEGGSNKEKGNELRLGRMNFDNEFDEDVGLFEYESLWDFELV